MLLKRTCFLALFLICLFATLANKAVKILEKGQRNPHPGMLFASRLGLYKKGNNRYRLPTEAQWKYAAHAGSTTAYHFGNSASNLFCYAWYGGNSKGGTRPVGQKPVNACGIHEVHGNAW